MMNIALIIHCLVSHNEKDGELNVAKREKLAKFCDFFSKLQKLRKVAGIGKSCGTATTATKLCL